MTETKNTKEVAQAVKDAVRTVYKDDWCREAGWEIDKPTVITALRELNKHFDDWGGDEPSCCVFKEIVDIIKELEKL